MDAVAEIILYSQFFLHKEVPHTQVDLLWRYSLAPFADVSGSQELQVSAIPFETQVHYFFLKKKALCVWLYVCVCVQEQFIWMTKIPIRVDKGLTHCVFKTMTTLTFYKFFASGIR